MRALAECIPLPPSQLVVPAHERGGGEQERGGWQCASQGSR